MFATNGLRVTCFVAKRLHAPRPRVADPASLRPNSFASAPIGIAPAHANTVATATDAITRFDPLFRPRRSSFVRAIGVVRVEFLLSIRCDSMRCDVKILNTPRAVCSRLSPRRVASRCRWNSSVGAFRASLARTLLAFRASKSRRRVDRSNVPKEISRNTQTVFGSTNRDSQYAVGTKMMVYKGSIYGLQQNTPKRKTCGDVSFGGIFGVARDVDVVVRVVGA